MRKVAELQSCPVWVSFGVPAVVAWVHLQLVICFVVCGFGYRLGGLAVCLYFTRRAPCLPYTSC